MKPYIALAAVVACSGPSVESQITITEGVYGLLDNAQGLAMGNADVYAFGPQGQSDPLGSGVSNRDGVYQIGVVGEFWLCVSSSCTNAIVNVPAGTLVRYDWTANGPDGGQWWSYSTAP